MYRILSKVSHPKKRCTRYFLRCHTPRKPPLHFKESTLKDIRVCTPVCTLYTPGIPLGQAERWFWVYGHPKRSTAMAIRVIQDSVEVCTPQEKCTFELHVPCYIAEYQKCDFVTSRAWQWCSPQRNIPFWLFFGVRIVHPAWNEIQECWSPN